ncbi:methionyl-tRNA formyltransferase [Phormidesmis priestleyi ULC007]|uniref:Methionyl-tRNA formyltransferase n=1 Tax=Phormidesmis priestleyi ULC007 TaxID=1920490 RepID=A0A2T1DEQ1_9CYAN|nr:methionyl-tRNA formyltransferase [Phormidesmis priestleyi]PSB18937.1 methionyl-tRNA formyltransferase [Phormidesmis priestleyi ULC007]PZO53925.1 MAG: methionyl-tRNA formyltransferase [Phormidesmis priestleyi]
MKIVFFGTPQFAVPTLEALLANPAFEVVAVVTQPDKRRGRGNELSASPVKSVALAHQIPVWQPKSVKKDAETLEKLQTSQADGFVVVAYGQILSQAILDMPKLGCVNVHGSLLPHYRGAAPIQWCLYNGETETGITTMLMDAGMDTGAMLLKVRLPIALLDNAHDLAEKLSPLGANLLIETLLKLANQDIQPIAQENSQATYAPLIKKENYELDWSRGAIELHNQVRGFYPNCTTAFRGTALKIMATVPIAPSVELSSEFAMLTSLADGSDQAAGEIVVIVKNLGAVIQTGDGLLFLREAQLAGKRPQSGWDFANGSRLAIGERLGN